MQTSVLIIAHLSPIASSCNCPLLSCLYGGRLQVKRDQETSLLCDQQGYCGTTGRDVLRASPGLLRTPSSLKPEHHLVVDARPAGESCTDYMKLR